MTLAVVVVELDSAAEVADTFAAATDAVEVADELTTSEVALTFRFDIGARIILCLREVWTSIGTKSTERFALAVVAVALLENLRSDTSWNMMVGERKVKSTRRKAVVKRMGPREFEMWFGMLKSLQRGVRYRDGVESTSD